MLDHCKKVDAFFFNQDHSGERLPAYSSMRCTQFRHRPLVWGFIVGGEKSIRFTGTCSKADAKEWMLLQIKMLLLFSCQPMFLLFVYFLTVPAFILLFQAVIFHICIYFHVEMVLKLQKLFSSCYSSSRFPAHCSNAHLPCCFIPSLHTAVHSLSFLKQR